MSKNNILMEFAAALFALGADCAGDGASVLGGGVEVELDGLP